MRVWRLSPWRLINGFLLVLGLIAVLVYWATGGFDDKSVFGAVRVNQLGYTIDEPKKAYLMIGDSAEGKNFELRSQPDNEKVFSGTIKPDNGSWNYEFSEIHVLDFSEFRAPGEYRIKITDDIDAESPTFPIGTGADLYTEQVSGALDGFFASQRDTVHSSDAQATVYDPPVFAGDELNAPLKPMPGHAPVDVTGGWYDASGYLKLTHTASYAAVCLALATDGFDNARLRDELRYGLDWLEKMWDPTNKVLYAQVGLAAGDSTLRIKGDQEVWREPGDDEELNTAPNDEDYYLKHRPVFSANDAGRGVPTNLAGRYAAAFALAAWTEPASDRANAYLTRAVDVYESASDSGEEVFTAYPATAFTEATGADDMSLAAAALARVGQRLGDSRAGQWRADAERWSTAAGAEEKNTPPGLGDVAMFARLTHALVVREAGDGAAFQQDIDGVSSELDLATEQAAKQPFGSIDEYLVPVEPLGIAVAERWFAAITEDPTYQAMSSAQRGFALGANPWGVSFVVGTGHDSPRCPHHQLANLREKPELVRGGATGYSAGRKGFTSADEPSGIRRCVKERYRFDSNDVKYHDSPASIPNTPTLDQSATTLLLFSWTIRERVVS